MKRRGNNAVWKTTRKAVGVIVLLIGIRLIWISMTVGWNNSDNNAADGDLDVYVEIKPHIAYMNLHDKADKLRHDVDNEKENIKQLEELTNLVTKVVNNNNEDTDKAKLLDNVTNMEDTKKQTITTVRADTGVLDNPDVEVEPKQEKYTTHNETSDIAKTITTQTIAEGDKNVPDVEENQKPDSINTESESKLLPKETEKPKKINIATIKPHVTSTGKTIIITTNKPSPTSTMKQPTTTTKKAPTTTSAKPVRQVPIEEARSFGVCQKTIPWGQKYHAKISTFDLAKKTNHTIDKNGEYPIPVKSIKEVQDETDVEPVKVILVPFSHADPGYGMTIEEYYKHKTHGTLNNMVNKLRQYPDLTFQWAETVFLARWFKDLSDDNKLQVKKLIADGRLEIVLGGWVMPDEASTHYPSVIDQLIEGHQWLIENLEVKPENAWVNDPFGYSSTMPYLWKSSGMENMVFLRIDQAVKAQLMKAKSLEFNWRPYWKYSNSSDMLASLMSYTNYWLGDVCGPDHKICMEFTFIHPDTDKESVRITKDNVAAKAKTLYEQYRRTAGLYKYNTLYMGLGEDFSFSKSEDWDNLYTNFKMLTDYINSKEEWKMNVKFGTLKEYFENVRNEEAKLSKEASQTTEMSTKEDTSFPTLSGDFYPYTEKKNEYWTGYFTTRPLNKRFSRELEPLIRSADIFNVMVYSFFKYYRVKYTAYKEVTSSLRTARRELGMFLHHDGITGTSLPHVVRDYENRLFTAHSSVQSAMKTLLSTLLTRGKHQNNELLQEETVKPHPRQMSQHINIDTAKETKLVLVNAISKIRKEVVNVFVTSKHVRIDSPSRSKIPFQITIPTNHKPGQGYWLTFPIELPSLGIEVFRIRPESKHVKADEVQEAEVPANTDDASPIVFENPFMKVEFDPVTGLLRQVTDSEGRYTNISAEFMIYQSTEGGAYIFGPASPAKLFSTGKRRVIVSRGSLVSEVKVTSPGFSHSVKFYHTSDVQGQGLHIDTAVDMASVGIKNMDVILRFKTDVQNGNHWFSDQNGYQMMGRETHTNRPIQSNYYPITTMAILEDRHKRLTLHSKQPHGAASLAQGQLEVMLDRHTFRDDGRGLGQGIYDNVKVNSDFVLQIEFKTVAKEIEELRYTYPTQDAALINELLQNNVFVYQVKDTNVYTVKKVHPLKATQLPCDLTVVGLRNLVKNNLDYNGTSLVLHRKSLQCGYQSLNKQCTNDAGKLTIRTLLPKLKVDVVETTLSHLHEIQKLTLDSDIRPDHMELRAFRIQV